MDAELPADRLERGKSPSNDFVTPAGSSVSDLEIVPPFVSRLAEALEKRDAIFGNIRCGKTWAAKIAFSKPVKKQLSGPSGGTPL